MGEMQRYNMKHDYDESGRDMAHENDSGVWVTHEDHLADKAADLKEKDVEIAELKAENESLHAQVADLHLQLELRRASLTVASRTELDLRAQVERREAWTGRYLSETGASIEVLHSWDAACEEEENGC